MSRYLLSARRWAVVAGLGAAVAGIAGCKRQDPDATNSFATSLIFDDASPDAREALATTVDFRVTDESFARWEEAQDKLDRLPPSALPSGAASGGSAIDRAVMRLESSPRARTAIESTGLSVRDFILATLALAQATQAMQPGVTASRSPIIAANSRFVSQYQARLLRSRAGAYAQSKTPESFDAQPEMGDEGAAEMNVQPEPGQVEQMQSRSAQQLETQPAIDSTAGRVNSPPARARADSARDSVPAVRRDTTSGRDG